MDYQQSQDCVWWAAWAIPFQVITGKGGGSNEDQVPTPLIYLKQKETWKGTERLAREGRDGKNWRSKGVQKPLCGVV